MSFITGSKPKGTDYGAIEAQKKREALDAENAAKETAFASELEKMKTQRGRAATILTTGSGKSTLG